MNKSDPINIYQKMAEAATFYLNEAFRHVDEAFEYELASHYFGKLLNEIDPNNEDLKLAKSSELQLQKRLNYCDLI